MSAVDIAQKEKYSRCIALEEDYVHQVYEKIGKDLACAKDSLEATVKTFLDKLEPGSVVADIGCGDGRHLRNENGVFTLGADNSFQQTSIANQNCQEALLGDNLRLPFRGNAFDAVLSVGVIHHFTTKKRRIQALQELARILKIGGRILIAVQRHNTQNSQDVLIPWFDVPKEKKDKHWFEQDSGEYELEDERDNGDDEDEEDSISLPSSDEDDTPLTNYAKLFPPKYHAKYGWNSERQSRSLDYDYQTTSNLVPNTKTLVQTNACYAFVKKALKRFSSVNNSDEDPYVASEFYQRVDSAVPPSPIVGQEQNFELLTSSSFNLDEALQKTISENFIELLNIDDDQNTSTYFSKTGCSYEISNTTASKNGTKNQGTLIRSLSDMFQNMNSLWSSKGTQSCNDLKSQTVVGANYFEGKEENKSRLVRSKTTATCNTEFDYLNHLEAIEELDMTVSEANRIINNFLESSMQDVETVKSERFPHEDCFPPLTQSDIVNGNALLHDSSSLVSKRTKCRLKRNDKQDYYINRYLFSDVKENCLKLTHEVNSREKFTPYKSDIYEENTKFTKESNSIFFTSDESSSNFKKLDYLKSKDIAYKYKDISTEKVYEKYKKNNVKCSLTEKYSFLFDEKLENFELLRSKENENFSENSQMINYLELDENISKSNGMYIEKNKLKSEKNNLKTRLSEKYSFLFDEKLDNYELAKLEGKEISLVDKKEKDVKEREVMTKNETESIVENENKISDKISNSHTSNQPSLNAYEKLPLRFINQNEYFCPTVTSNSISEGQNEPFMKPKSVESKVICSELKQSVLQTSNNSVNYKCVLHNSPKKCRKLNSNYQMPASKTLGPFYDEDNGYVCDADSSTLSSYYSMPELHALSEFYQEYSIYQNYLVNNTTAEFPALHNNQSLKTDGMYALNSSKKEYLKLKNIQDTERTDSLISNESLNSNISFKNAETDLCYVIHSNFKDSNSSLIENENICLNQPIVVFPENENEVYPDLSSISPKKYSPMQSNIKNKCIAVTCLKPDRKLDQVYNNIVSSADLKISRSHSIDSLEENRKRGESNINRTIFNLTSSHPSLLFYTGRKNETNCLISKHHQNQNQIFDSDSRHTIISENCEDKDINQQNVLLENNVLNNDIRAFHKTDEVGTTSISNLVDDTENITSNDSFEVVPYLKETVEKSICPRTLLSNECVHCELPTIFSDTKETIYKKLENLSTETKFKNHTTINMISEDDAISNTKDLGLFYQSDNKECKRNEQTMSDERFIEENSSEKFATDNHPENDSKVFQNSSIEPTGMSAREVVTGKTLVEKLRVLDSNSHSSKRDFPREFYDLEKKSSPENISESEVKYSSFHVDLVRSEIDFNNGAKTNGNLPIKEHPHKKEVSSTPLTNIEPCTVSSKSKHINSIKKTDEESLTNSMELRDENVNYAYGRIHEANASVVGHRYHHLFQEEELDDLIENNISDLHVIRSFDDGSHWCIVAEKVRVWSI